MKIAIVTDAWLPQVNGVVTTLVELRQGLIARGHEVVMVEPSGFRRFPCPGYREIELAWRPGRRVASLLQEAQAAGVQVRAFVPPVHPALARDAAGPALPGLSAELRERR